jgi:RND family efflux transporter MFP subunit
MREEVIQWSTSAYRSARSFFRERPGALRALTSAVIIVILFYGVRAVVAVVTAPRVEMTMSPIAGNAAVSVAAAAKGAIASTVTYTGTVVPYEEILVSPRVQGWMDDIRVDVGDKVHKGQRLVSLDKTELRAQLEEIRARRIDQEKELERDRTLVKAGAISGSTFDLRQSEYDSAKGEEEARAARLSYTDITAPITGEVTDRIKLINPGELVQPGTVLLKLADLRRVRVQVNVAEPDAPKIKVGTPVVVRLPNLPPPHDKVKARVTTIFPQMDPVTRTTKVEILVDNPTGLMRPDMYAVVDLVLEREKTAIIVPRQSVIELDGKPTVFTTDMVVAMVHPVKLGVVEGDRIQILEGINDGDMVIVDGNRGLTDGQAINVVSGP